MKTGVIIGRFQTHVIHQGHRYLLEYANNRTQQLIILLGEPQQPDPQRYPLNFQARKEMLHDEYPNAEIYPIYDCDTDEAWSKQLDRIVKEHAIGRVTLYGSRDSFIPYYKGQYRCEEITSPIHELSATAIRKQLQERPALSNPWFRAGMLYQSYRTQKNK